MNGRLFILVEKAGADSAAAKIGKILAQTAEYQTEAESRGMALAEKTVLPNLAASVLALPIAGPVGAVAVLGAGFGFNMRLISMLSMMNYLSIASRSNILVKHGRALDQLKNVNTFVFDKTGTLTLEQPILSRIHLCGNRFSENDILTFAAAAEYRQPHPIAKDILAEADKRNLDLPEIDEAAYEVGYGIKVKIDEKASFILI